MIQLNFYILLAIGITIFLVVCVFPLIIIGKSEKIAQLQKSFKDLKNSFNNLDEQAKLIVRTDLELNKAQEELDKRLNGLEALQKTSRLISTTLDETEIFSRLDQSLKTYLNFEKNLILLYNNHQELYNCVTIGFSANTVSSLIKELKNQLEIISLMENGKTLSSINTPKHLKDIILKLFDVEHFIFTPIVSQKGTVGFAFVGNESNTATLTEGDEEIISILTSQIAQALENARLFEEVFRSSQALEAKVHDRTRQLESALEDVQNVSKTKSEFISAVSHELRTPLTSIKGYASILMAGKLGEIPDPVKKRLEKINIHSDNLVKLINELLDISRIESGRVELKMTTCNLSTIIDNVHDLLTPQMKTKNIQWKTDIDANTPKMNLDMSQVERIFINLVSNAIKFTPEDGTISIKTHVNNNEVAVDVSDTGIGISDEDIKRLFDEFYRVDNAINQNVKGTGLGLALVKKIVEAHKGRIWITSKMNQGTTFHFTLPIT